MAFWALGAFEKVKTMTEKLKIKDVSKKVISYVAQQHEGDEQWEGPSLYRDSFKEESTPVEPKRIVTSKERMEIQLNEYKKLVKMQDEIMESHYKREKELLLEKQAELEKENRALVQQEEAARKAALKGMLIEQIESGEKSIEEVITENIMMKESILLARQQ